MSSDNERRMKNNIGNYWKMDIYFYCSCCCLTYWLLPYKPNSERKSYVHD